MRFTFISWNIFQIYFETKNAFKFKCHHFIKINVFLSGVKNIFSKRPFCISDFNTFYIKKEKATKIGDFE